jgi:hypothetical protein
LFGIEHFQNSRWGDFDGMDIEKGFRVAIDSRGLTEKAKTKGIDVATTGDGAANYIH